MAIKRSTGRSRSKARVTLLDEFENVKKKLYKDASDVILKGFADIVEETPVLTGYAQSNWKVSWGGTSESIAPAKDGGPYRSKEQVIEDGKSVIKLIEKYGFQNNIKFFNSTPYINELEYGHSSKNSFFIKRSTLKMKNNLSGLRG